MKRMNSAGWVRRTVERELDPIPVHEKTRRAISAALRAETVTTGPLVLSAFVIAAFATATLLAYWLDWTFVPSLAPDDPDATLSTIWQAHTAIVGLSIPLLVLLLEQANSRTVLATSAVEIMVSDSWLVVTTTVSMSAVISIGVSSIYFPSDGGVGAALALTSLCVLLILRGYRKSFELIVAPRRLRGRSRQLLLRRLGKSVTDSFVVSASNERISLALERWVPQRISDRALRDHTWTAVTSSRSGIIHDINVDELARLLTRTVTPVPVGEARMENENQPDRLSQGWPTAIDDHCRVLVRPLGESVRVGDPIVAIRAPAGDVDEADFERAIRIGGGDV
jgi:hypothetical protein